MPTNHSRAPCVPVLMGSPGGINWALGHLLGRSLAYVSPVLRSVFKVKRSSLGNSKVNDRKICQSEKVW